MGTSSTCPRGDLMGATAFTGLDSDSEQLRQFGGYNHLDPPHPPTHTHTTTIKVWYLETQPRSLLRVNLVSLGFWVYSHLNDCSKQVGHKLLHPRARPTAQHPPRHSRSQAQGYPRLQHLQLHKENLFQMPTFA